MQIVSVFHFLCLFSRIIVLRRETVCEEDATGEGRLAVDLD